MSGIAQFLLFGPFFHDGALVTAPQLYHYVPGTSTEKTAWEDRNQVITAANPIVGDANGLVAGYFDGLYKIEVRTSDDSVQLVQYDNVQIIDTVDEVAPAEVRPEDFDGEAADSVDNADAVLEAIEALPAGGGAIRFGPGDYQYSRTLACGTKAVLFQGAGLGVTYLTMTSVSSLLHGITGTSSLWVRDLTMRTQSPLTTNYQMQPVRLNLDGTGISSGREFHMERAAFEGWNTGPYCDGGAAYGIERASVDKCRIVPSGPAGATYIGSSVHLNRVQHGWITRNTINQNHIGEHAIYCFGPQNVAVLHNTISNASLSESQAVKIVGDATAPTQIYGEWIVEGNTMAGCFHGITMHLYGTERLKLAHIGVNSVSDIPGSINLFGGLVTFNVLGSSVIEQAVIRTNQVENLGYQAIHFTGGGTAKIKQAIIDGLRVKGWSQASSGTYTLLGSNATVVIVDELIVRNVRVDGDSTGREIWNVNGFGGYGAESIAKLAFDYESCSEVNTTSGPFMPGIRSITATPTLRFGRKYILNNGTAWNITGFTDMTPGVEYEFRVTTANNVLTDGANLVMAGSVNWTPNATDRFKCTALTATAAEESGRSDNT